MNSAIAYLDRTFYPGLKKNWDDEIFRTHVLGLLRPSHAVLDLGAGAGIVPQLDFLGHAQSVCGVDPDERVTSNPYLDEGRVGTGESIPYPDNTFDIVVTANVLEHLAAPRAVFLEVRRVLKPGGRFVFKTPNRWHYMPIIAQLTPTRFHKSFNRLRGRAVEDTFPTLYRANSKAQIEALAAYANFNVTRLRFVEGRPEYLRFSTLTYLAGTLYERVSNRFDLLANLRVVMIGELEKPRADPPV